MDSDELDRLPDFVHFERMGDGRFFTPCGVNWAFCSTTDDRELVTCATCKEVLLGEEWPDE